MLLSLFHNLEKEVKDSIALFRKAKSDASVSFPFFGKENQQ